MPSIARPFRFRGDSAWRGKEQIGETFGIRAHLLGPSRRLPVFINDVPWVTPPATSWWVKLIQSKALWLAAAQINRELKQLMPVLLSPTVGSEVEYSLKTEGTPVSQLPITCLLKPHPDGGYVLLSANLDDAVLNVIYDFPAGLGSVEPLFENRDAISVIEDGKRFSDRYEPFEAHVYRILPKP